MVHGKKIPFLLLYCTLSTEGCYLPAEFSGGGVIYFLKLAYSIHSTVLLGNMIKLIHKKQVLFLETPRITLPVIPI